MPARGNRVTCGAVVTGPVGCDGPNSRACGTRAMCVARPKRPWTRAYTRAAVPTVAWQGQAGRVVCERRARLSVRLSMRGAKHESENSSGRGKRACCDQGKSRSGTVSSEVRQLQASKEVSRQRQSRSGKHGDFRILAPTPPGPRTVYSAVVDIRGPRSRPPRDDQQTKQEHY